MPRRRRSTKPPSIRPGPGYSLPALPKPTRRAPKGIGREARSVWEAPVMAAEMLEKTVTAIGKRYLEQAEKRARTIAALRERVSVLEAQCTNWERVDQEQRATIARLEKSLVDSKALLDRQIEELDATPESTEPAKVSTTSPKCLPDRESVKPHRARGGPSYLGTKVGAFVVVEKLPENYHGQSMWLLRCPDCESELRWYAAKIKRSHRAPLCKCANVPEEAIGKRATGPTLPRAAKPVPLATPSVAVRTSAPNTGETFFRRSGFTDMVGETVATFRCVGRAPDTKRADGAIVWLFRCTECGAERRWTRSDVNRIRAHNRGLHCDCQGGRRGRPPRGMAPKFLEPPKEERNLDDLDADELEAAVLSEFERDRSIPRLRTDQSERRSFDMDLDSFERPSDSEEEGEDQDETEELDFDEASGGE